MDSARASGAGAPASPPGLDLAGYRRRCSRGGADLRRPAIALRQGGGPGVDHRRGRDICRAAILLRSLTLPSGGGFTGFSYGPRVGLFLGLIGAPSRPSWAFSASAHRVQRFLVDVGSESGRMQAYTYEIGQQVIRQVSGGRRHGAVRGIRLHGTTTNYDVRTGVRTQHCDPEQRLKPCAQSRAWIGRDLTSSSAGSASRFAASVRDSG